jgi:hypothetical protein
VKAARKTTSAARRAALSAGIAWRRQRLAAAGASVDIEWLAMAYGGGSGHRGRQRRQQRVARWRGEKSSVTQDGHRRRHQLKRRGGGFDGIARRLDMAAAAASDGGSASTHR